MARGTPAMVIRADTSEGQHLAGFVSEFNAQVMTNRYKRDLVHAVHGHYAKEFDAYLSALAKNNPNAYHHVFEPRMVGINRQDAKLWVHVRRGTGDSIQAAFNFIPSKYTILTPYERLGSRIKDPIQKIPSYYMDEYLKYYDAYGAKTYVFRDKAMIMEYDIRTRINPVNVEYLFVPDPSFNKGFRFSVDEFADNRDRGVETAGRFTAAWATYWGTHVAGTFSETVGRAIEKDLGRNVREGVRRRRKSVTLGAVTDAGAFERGRDQAKAAIQDNLRYLHEIEEGGETFSGII